MSYVDAGYSIALGVLFLYTISLFVRRRRLERAVAVAASDHADYSREILGSRVGGGRVRGGSAASGAVETGLGESEPVEDGPIEDGPIEDGRR